MIEIYYAPPSIYGRKVLTVLEEKGLDYTIHKMSFATQDHLKEDYLKLNPNGEIPTLIDEEQIIYESTAIIEYLNEEYPFPPLMPEGSYERAQVRMIDDFCDIHFYPLLVNCFIQKFVRNQEWAEEEIQNALSKLSRIEQFLGNREYLVGQFSLADCAVMPAVATMDIFGWSNRLGAFPSVKKYVERLRGRRSYIKGASLVKLD